MSPEDFIAVLERLPQPPRIIKRITRTPEQREQDRVGHAAYLEQLEQEQDL